MQVYQARMQPVPGIQGAEVKSKIFYVFTHYPHVPGRGPMKFLGHPPWPKEASQQLTDSGYETCTPVYEVLATECRVCEVRMQAGRTRTV